VQERVRAGATLLDGVVPGWARKINAASLKLESCTGCVLGQVFASEINERSVCVNGYEAGRLALGLDSGPWSQAAAFGFHNAYAVPEEQFRQLPENKKAAVRCESYREYGLLRDCWLAEIAARLETADASTTDAEKAAWAGCPL
jgi:hypothetical protein